MGKDCAGSIGQTRLCGKDKMTRLAWLAGFIDGEGSLGIHKHHKTYMPMISIYNTSAETMEHVKRLLGELEVNYCFTMYDPSKRTGSFGQKTMYTIHIRKRTSVISLLRSIIPYMITKRARAQMMLDYYDVQPKRSRLTLGGLALANRVKTMNA